MIQNQLESYIFIENMVKTTRNAQTETSDCRVTQKRDRLFDRETEKKKKKRAAK